MLNLIMVLHCHQPVGNFDHVFQMAMEKCYRPILDLLNAHPAVKVGLHFSGPLLEWMEKNQPEGLDIISVMIRRKQIEMLSGGFFEPLLATIPERDARGQVRMMNDYISNRFGVNPTGFWLAERVWDPGLPKILEGTGMTYTIVDDTHFYYSGLRPHEIYGIYVTEKEGHTMRLFATPMLMRYLIPFKQVEEVIGYLRGQEEMGRDLALYGDDGEKFGLWPGTYEWVIEKSWLENFFSAIEKNGDWLKTTLPGEFSASTPPMGRLYLPQASYEEMTEWALPPERAHVLEETIKTLKNEGRWDEWRPFVRGGVWDNFLVKYEESNRMHKKMLFLSERVTNNEEAKEYLWRSQCNCAYWHGVFGGLYLGHLRRAVHENLIRVQECVIRESKNRTILFRYDKDGREEILVWGQEVCLGIAPDRGGGIFDLSHIPSKTNFSDTLTRRAEAYHYDINKEVAEVEGNDRQSIPSIHDIAQSGSEDLTSLLVYDAYTRMSLLEHFLGGETTPHDYSINNYHEGGDFLTGRYGVEYCNVHSDEAAIKMSREGSIGKSAIFLAKEVRLDRDSNIHIDYEFGNRDSDALSTRFGCEFNLNLYSDQDPEIYYFVPDSGRRRTVSETGTEDGLNGFELVNDREGLKLSFGFSKSVSVWFFPLMTISKSEEGFEYTYQGTSLLFLFSLELSPGENKTLQIQIRFINTRE